MTLAAEAVALLSGAGIGRDRALGAILPLMRATIDNLEASGLAAGLTGPVVRGDDVTLRRHAELLRRAPEGLRELHRLLVRRTARLARSAGALDAPALRRLDRALGRKQERAEKSRRKNGPQEWPSRAGLSCGPAADPARSLPRLPWLEGR